MANSRESGKSSLIERAFHRLRRAIERPIGQPERAREEVPVGWDFGPEGQPGTVTSSDKIGSAPLPDPPDSRDVGPIGGPPADATIRGDASEIRPSEPTDESVRQYVGRDDAGLGSGRPEAWDRPLPGGHLSETASPAPGVASGGGATGDGSHVPANAAGDGQATQYTGHDAGDHGTGPDAIASGPGSASDPVAYDPGPGPTPKPVAHDAGPGPTPEPVAHDAGPGPTLGPVAHDAGPGPTPGPVVHDPGPGPAPDPLGMIRGPVPLRDPAMSAQVAVQVVARVAVVQMVA
jgi:hypothetical protein